MSKLRQLKRAVQREAPKFEPLRSGDEALTPELVGKLLPGGVPIPPDLLMQVGELLGTHQMRNLAAALAAAIQSHIDHQIVAAQDDQEKRALVTVAREAHAKKIAALEELKRSA